MRVALPSPSSVVVLAAVVVLVAVPVLIPAALGPRYGGDLTVGVLDLPPTADPPVPRGPGERLVAGLVHETLVGAGAEGWPAPALARSWGTSAGGKEWTLKLRAGARFHDDAPVTADDAVRSLRRFLRSPSPAAAVLAASLEGGAAFRSATTEDLRGLAAADPQTLVLRFPEAQSAALAPLAAPAAAVTGLRGAGAGPFVPAVVVPGRRFSFTPFSSHIHGRPFLDAVAIVATPDRAALRADLQSGRVDVAAGEAGWSSEDSGGAVAATLLLVLDAARPPFDRGDARAALAAAIDTADLVRNFVPGGDPIRWLLVPALLPPLPGEVPSAPPAATSAPPAATSARGALPPVVSIAVATDVSPVVSQRVVAYLAARSCQAGVEAANPARVWRVPAQARLLLWSPEVPEASLAIRELMALAAPAPAAEGAPGADGALRAGGALRAEGALAAAEEALTAASREADPDRRRVHLFVAEAALRAQGVLLPLASIPISFGARRGVHGIRVDLSGRLVLEDAWVEP